MGPTRQMSTITGFVAAQKYLRWRFLLLIVGGVLVIIPAALAFSSGLLSPRGLPLVMVAYAGCVAVAVFIILLNARAKFKAASDKSTDFADDATRERFRKQIRRLQFGVAFFALVLVYALWETRNEPWPPRLVGAAINLLFQTVMIQSIRRIQKQLKQETSDQHQ